ncbi:hypothetical protein GCM10009784_08110 [Arthrobacter parietis]|uniref:GIY-YIG domain-containing protein n=1 Tax=Arthrobacter parietis TaxID=271434 RepID=A0ABN3AQJ0_9MICC
MNEHPLDDVVWSEWLVFEEAARSATNKPGVYRVRHKDSGAVVYVGHAGPRASESRNGGVLGRLAKYRGGHMSGLGYQALNKAVLDPEWVGARLNELRSGERRLATYWVQQAIIYADLEVSWTESANKDAAKRLEALVKRSGRTSETLWSIR